MKELIEQIAKALVDNPDQVSVRPIEGEQSASTVLAPFAGRGRHRRRARGRHDHTGSQSAELTGTERTDRGRRSDDSSRSRRSLLARALGDHGFPAGAGVGRAPADDVGP